MHTAQADFIDLNLLNVHIHIRQDISALGAEKPSTCDTSFQCPAFSLTPDASFLASNTSSGINLSTRLHAQLKIIHDFWLQWSNAPIIQMMPALLVCKWLCTRQWLLATEKSFKTNSVTSRLHVKWLKLLTLVLRQIWSWAQNWSQNLMPSINNFIWSYLHHATISRALTLIMVLAPEIKLTMLAEFISVLRRSSTYSTKHGKMSAIRDNCNRKNS